MENVLRTLVISIPLLLGSASAVGQDTGAILGFRSAGTLVAELDTEQLKRDVPVHRIRFFNYLMGKEKSYGAFSIQDLLDMVYGTDWRSGGYSDIAFRALDGYEAVSSIELLLQSGGYLAFEDLDQDTGWEPVGRRNADPGPFFLVWTESHQTTANSYPWPWQLAEIGLIRFKDRYPDVIPRDTTEDSPVWAGYELFRARCLRCHAIDQQGGKIGPDLHSPRNIVSYRSEEMIKAYVYQPSAYRHTHMPDHTDLSEHDLDNLYQYLNHLDKTRR